jgi:N-acetyl-1-D-myo-inositol-2-amino-2-deoxy-alpha-D-glucopyranoside deacetylase
MDEAVAELVAVLRDFRPHVVVTYDPNGGYGHPDHVQAHRVTTAAVAASSGDGHPGEPWQVPKFYWTVMDGESMAEALESLNGIELPETWVRIPASALPFDLGHRIDAIIDAPDSLPAKVAAMRAHETQVTVEPSGRVFALSNNIALPIAALEHYVLVDGTAGERDDRGVETDLLSGINLA